jgi:2TM domain
LVSARKLIIHYPDSLMIDYNNNTSDVRKIGTIDMNIPENQIITTYASEDAQEILKLAIARREDKGELTRVQLVEIATEMGVSQEDLLAAEQEWFLYRGDVQERKQFNDYRQGIFKQNAERFLIVNAFLIVLNLVTSGTLSWCWYILIIWGLGLTLNAWQTFKSNTEEYEKAFQRWKLRKQLGLSIGTLADRVLKALQS